jgi:hypothetical protein
MPVDVVLIATGALLYTVTTAVILMASQLATKDDAHTITATGCDVQERDDHRSHRSMKDAKGARLVEDDQEARSGTFTDYENAVDPASARDGSGSDAHLLHVRRRYASYSTRMFCF